MLVPTNEMAAKYLPALEKARLLLARAETIDEARHAVGITDAIRSAAARGRHREAEILAIVANKEAWRYCGMLLSKYKTEGRFGQSGAAVSPEKQRQRKAADTRRYDLRKRGRAGGAYLRESKLSLRKLGLSLAESAYAQRLALLPDKEFKRRIDDWKQRAGRCRGLRLPPCLPRIDLPNLGTIQNETRERLIGSRVFFKAFTARGRKDAGKYSHSEMTSEIARMAALLEPLIADYRLALGMEKKVRHAIGDGVYNDVLPRKQILAMEKSANRRAASDMRRLRAA